MKPLEASEPNSETHLVDVFCDGEGFQLDLGGELSGANVKRYACCGHDGRAGLVCREVAGASNSFIGAHSCVHFVVDTCHDPC